LPSTAERIRLSRFGGEAGQKQRIGEKLGSRATYGEGTQNVLCAILAGAVLVGLAANALFGLWWLDPAVALVIAAACVREGQKAWRGEECGCRTRKTARAGFYILCFLRGRRSRQKSHNGTILESPAKSV
jgi:hypothetical protein